MWKGKDAAFPLPKTVAYKFYGAISLSLDFESGYDAAFNYFHLHEFPRNELFLFHRPLTVPLENFKVFERFLVGCKKD
jgi:hypothetical protein